MTGSGLGLDIYVEMTAPRMRVTVEEGPDNRLEVQIGTPHTSVTGETSTVHLWFKRPDAVIELGKELISKGQTFLDQHLEQVAGEEEHQSGGVSDAG
jgi:hypothetical protein